MNMPQNFFFRISRCCSIFAAFDARRHMSKFLSKSATKRLPLTTKRARKGYYKGKGGTKEGKINSKGRFIVDHNKRVELIVPDLTGFKVSFASSSIEQAVSPSFVFPFATNIISTWTSFLLAAETIHCVHSVEVSSWNKKESWRCTRIAEQTKMCSGWLLRLDKTISI